jgi:hypothetical protein
VGTAWATDNALSNANIIAILIGLLGMSVAIGWVSGSAFGSASASAPSRIPPSPGG